MEDPAEQAKFRWQPGMHPLITEFTAELTYGGGQKVTLSGKNLYMQAGYQHGSESPLDLLSPHDIPVPEPLRIVFDIRLASAESRLSISQEARNDPGS